MSKHTSHPLSWAGMLVTLGIVFGDIGTSPLYVFKAIVHGHGIEPRLIYGGISCIIWTITLQTTFKYIYLTLQADNRGEGGVFSLYALVRRYGRWVYIPAIIGATTLLAGKGWWLIISARAERQEPPAREHYAFKRAIFGSNSGSSRTVAGRRSPKYSISIAVPGALSAIGR